ncbi:hypothetical protein BH23GEM6_BH23GEM6_14410 [soil metagenome]
MPIRRNISTVFAFALLSLTACSNDDRPASDRGAPIEIMPQGAEMDLGLAQYLPAGATVEQAQLGHRLFTVCTVCHGLDAEGTQLAPSFIDGEWIHVEPEVDQIAQIIRTGVSNPIEFAVPMPPQGGGDFDDEELRALAVYILAVSNRAGTQ